MTLGCQIAPDRMTLNSIRERGLETSDIWIRLATETALDAGDQALSAREVVPGNRPIGSRSAGQANAGLLGRKNITCAVNGFDENRI